MRPLLVLVLAGVTILAGCSAGTETTIPSQDPGLVEAGSEPYAAHCAQCHGGDLRGTGQGPSLLSQVYEPGHHGDGAFLIAVIGGVRPHHWDFGPMPPIEGLTPEDVEAIVAFVREAQRVEGFEPYPPWGSGR
ncbi:MAG: cytochrome c [Acidimicrobiia bacterium]|jgi:mono/diheme cytochrome c family protein